MPGSGKGQILVNGLVLVSGHFLGSGLVLVRGQVLESGQGLDRDPEVRIGHHVSQKRVARVWIVAKKSGGHHLSQ